MFDFKDYVINIMSLVQLECNAVCNCVYICTNTAACFMMHTPYINHNFDVCQMRALIRHTVQPFTERSDTRCCDNTICPPEDGHVDARNMSRIVM